MKVKIKRLSEKAVIPFKTYEKDFCYDVVATSKEEIAPNVFKYKLGLAFQIERGYETIFSAYNEFLKDNTKTQINMANCPFNLSIDFRPRSSVWKTGMVLSNCEATIDELYNGEVCAIFYKVVENGEPYNIGDKIGQIKLGITIPMKFVEVDELDDTERGANGFGSTGK